jgi:Protein of unknown function (Hypoth_ymh)
LATRAGAASEEAIILTISPDDAVQLPVDELAMLILRDLATWHEANEYNYGNSLRQDTARGYAGNPDARKAVSEGMAWLHARGLIARKIEEHSSHTIFVTRWGHEALSLSLPAVRAVERIQENLHPLIGQRVRRQFLLGEYEQAIFVAMKAVEVRVRRLAGFPDEIIGTDLMTRALKPGGPLADPLAEKLHRDWRHISFARVLRTQALRTRGCCRARLPRHRAQPGPPQRPGLPD